MKTLVLTRPLGVISAQRAGRGVHVVPRCVYILSPYDDKPLQVPNTCIGYETVLWLFVPQTVFPPSQVRQCLPAEVFLLA